MGTTLATYYAKLQDMPDSEYKVEILEDGPIKKIAVNGKIYEVDYNMGGDSIHSIIIRLNCREKWRRYIMPALLPSLWDVR